MSGRGGRGPVIKYNAKHGGRTKTGWWEAMMKGLDQIRVEKERERTNREMKRQ